MVLLFDHSTLADHCVVIELEILVSRIGSGAFVEARQTVFLMDPSSPIIWGGQGGHICPEFPEFDFNTVKYTIKCIGGHGGHIFPEFPEFLHLPFWS